MSVLNLTHYHIFVVESFVALSVAESHAFVEGDYPRRAEVVCLLLLGGDKSSQKRDVKRAIEMAQNLDKE